MLKSVFISLKFIFLIGCLVLAGAGSPRSLLAQEHLTPLSDGAVIGLRADDGKYVGEDKGPSPPWTKSSWTKPEFY